MTDLTGTAALIALRKAGGGGTPSLTTKYIYSPGVYDARDDGYDGYSEVEVDAYPYMGEKTITDNGVYYATDEGYSGFYEIYVDVSLALPMKIGTTMDDISKIMCEDDRVIDMDYNEMAIWLEKFDGQMIGVFTQSTSGYDLLTRGYVQEGGYIAYSDLSTLHWTMDSNGLLTGSIYWGPFSERFRNRVFPYGMMRLEDSHRNPDTGYYEYDQGEQALATFSVQTYFNGWGDPSHRLILRQGDRY